MSITDSLALKYRPKKLSEVIGQPVVVKAFTNAFKSKTLHHAYILAGNYGCGKCVTGDTLIMTHRGLKYIKDIVPRKEGLSPINCEVADGQGIGHTFFGYYAENSNTKRIINNLGIKIEGTLDHPISFFNTESCSIEWKRIEDIKEGDILPIYRKSSFSDGKRGKTILCDDKNRLKEEYLAYKSKDLKEKVVCPICDKVFLQMNTHLKTHQISIDGFRKTYGQNYPLQGREFYLNNVRKSIRDITYPSKVNAEFARFLGYLLSEGNIVGNSIIFTNSDSEVLKDFETISHNLFNVKICKKKDNRRKGLYNYKIHSGLLVYYIEKIGGINFKSREKHIPKSLFEWDYRYVKEFLKALFEGDGGVNGRRVSYYTVSNRLASELQQVLLSMGIISYLKKEVKTCTNCVRKNGHVCYSINISGLDLKLFFEEVGFISIRKKELLLNLIKENKTNNDTIPGIAKKVYNFIREYIPISKSGKIQIGGMFYNSPKKPSNFTTAAKNNKNISYSKLSEVI